MSIAFADPATVVVPISSEADLIRVRRTLRAAGEAERLSLVEQTKLITAGSELARNILVYATGSRGEVMIEQVRSGERQGVRATFSDGGPGIGDLEAAMTDGYSSTGSLGLGLPGSKRLVDEFSLDSSPGSGTTVVILKWRR